MIITIHTDVISPPKPNFSSFSISKEAQYISISNEFISVVRGNYQCLFWSTMEPTPTVSKMHSQWIVKHLVHQCAWRINNTLFLISGDYISTHIKAKNYKQTAKILICGQSDKNTCLGLAQVHVICKCYVLRIILINKTTFFYLVYRMCYVGPTQTRDSCSGNTIDVCSDVLDSDVERVARVPSSFCSFLQHLGIRHDHRLQAHYLLWDLR